MYLLLLVFSNYTRSQKASDDQDDVADNNIIIAFRYNVHAYIILHLRKVKNSERLFCTQGWGSVFDTNDNGMRTKYVRQNVQIFYYYHPTMCLPSFF